MTKYNLFLDDYREPKDTFKYTNNQIYLINWVIAKNYGEFVSIIKERGMAEIISFDHDLADEHYNPNEQYDNYIFKTGYDCAEWLINHCIDNGLDLPKTILIHSMNPQGSLNIESIFNSYAKIFGLKIMIDRYDVVKNKIKFF